MAWTAEASTTLQLAPADAFGLLTAYDRFQEWLPEITHSRVLASEGDIVIAELLCPRFCQRPVVFELVHNPPRSVVFSQADRYRQHGLSGRWELEPAGEGGEQVVLSISAQAPASLRTLGGRRALREGLGLLLDALRREAVRARRSQADPRERRKILEVVQGAQGLVVWLDGETYELRRRSPESDAG